MKTIPVNLEILINHHSITNLLNYSMLPIELDVLLDKYRREIEDYWIERLEMQKEEYKSKKLVLTDNELDVLEVALMNWSESENEAGKKICKDLAERFAKWN